MQFCVELEQVGKMQLLQFQMCKWAHRALANTNLFLIMITSMIALLACHEPLCFHHHPLLQSTQLLLPTFLILSAALPEGMCIRTQQCAKFKVIFFRWVSNVYKIIFF